MIALRSSSGSVLRRHRQHSRRGPTLCTCDITSTLCAMNKRLIAIHFLHVYALCLYRPFFPLFLQGMGMSPMHIGFLQTAQLAGMMVCGPIWNLFSDKFRLHYYVWIGASLISTIPIALLPSMRTFPQLLSIVLIAAFFMSPNAAILNAQTMHTLGRMTNAAGTKNAQDEYGKYRLFGAIGWGLGAAMFGPIVQAYGPAVSFYAYAVVEVLCVWVISGFERHWGLEQRQERMGEPVKEEQATEKKGKRRPRIGTGTERGGTEQQEEQQKCTEQNATDEGSSESPSSPEQPPLSFCSKLVALFSSPRYMFFLFIMTVEGVAAASVGLYLLMFVRELGGSYTLAGLTVVFQTLGEIPVFWLSRQMLRTWGEPVMLGVSMLAYVLRMFFISILRNPWWVLPIQLLHGTSYAIAWTAGVSLANKYMPPGLESTAMGLLGFCYQGVGCMSGVLIGGWLYQHYGPRAMYRVKAAGILAVLVVYALVFCMPRLLARLRGSRREGEGAEGNGRGGREGEEPMSLLPTAAGRSHEHKETAGL